MTVDPRRFDEIERVVRDTRGGLEDIRSTVLSRLASHIHPTVGDVITTGVIARDTAWQTFTFANSWTDNAFARYRLMPDGTVQMRGVITKNTNPTNTEAWCTALPAAYRPSTRMTFLCACSARPYNGTQKIEIQTTGVGNIVDMAAALGDVVLDSIRYPVI